MNKKTLLHINGTTLLKNMKNMVRRLSHDRATLQLLFLQTCLLMSFAAHAQPDLLKGFGKGVGKLVSKSIGDKGSEEIVALDSVDFQFAISENQNAGFFDIEQHGETSSKLMYAFKESEDKSLVEKARDTLQVGLGMYEIRRYKLAETEILGVKQLLESNRLTNEIVYLRTMSNLGLIYLAQGQNATAESYIKWSLDESRDKLTQNSAAYIANLNNYAKLHQSLGRYNEAEKEFNEALRRSDEIFGEGMQRAILLNNKAMLFQVMGRYEEAIALMKEAMDASTKAPKKVFQGAKSFDNRKFEANLATLYQVSGRYADAEQSYLSIRRVFENRRQTNNAEYAGLLNELAVLYIQMDKTAEVEDLLLKSASVYNRRYGEDNIYYAKVINDLGNFYRQAGRYAAAEEKLNKSFSIRTGLLEPTHPDFVKTQEDLAILYWKTSRIEKAYLVYKEVMDKTVDFVSRYFPPMSEAEKTNYWDVTRTRFQRFFNFALESRDKVSGLMDDFYNYHLATKALLLNATSKVKNTILASHDAALIKDYLTWLDEKEQLARMYAYSKSKLKAQHIDLKELEEHANAMEKSLSERSADFSSGYTAQKVTYQQILDALGDGEAVVDIVRIKAFDKELTDLVKYVAIILKKGARPLTVVELEEGNQLETRYAKYYQSTVKLRMDDDTSYGHYWSKIEKEITGIKTIYLSPDGAYSQLNVNTLHEPGGDYVINRHDITIIGNSRDLITIKSRPTTSHPKKAVLMGFPDYATPDVPSLPGTKAELDNIARILKAGGYSVTQFMQKDASEKNLKNASSPSLLHIATHGYFLSDVEGSQGSLYGVDAENASQNPLLRSGLILADANKAIDGTETIEMSAQENGVLTAYEAMNLNLEGTTLVVLSACETGLGDVKAGEGVYGLQRAFLVAGAESLIMSLWKVDDAATQLLMTHFYNNWVKLGNKQKAFKQAQIQLMAEYPQPYYWGAFVMIGY